jgi:hypothetical protein
MTTSRRNALSSTALALIPLAIAINIAIGQLATGLPFYLDSIGTVLVGALLGPWWGLLTGVLSNVIWTLLGNPIPIWFAYVAGVIGILAGLAGRAGFFQRPSPPWLSALIVGVFFFGLALFLMMFLYPVHADPQDLSKTYQPNDPSYASGVVLRMDPDFSPMKPGDENYSSGTIVLPEAASLLRVPTAQIVFVIAVLAGLALGYLVLKNAGYAGLAGLITGVIAAIISAPMAAWYFGGVTGSGTDALVAAFRQSGAGILQSTLAQGTVSDPFDKMTSFMLVWLIIQSLPRRILQRFPNSRAINEAQPVASTSRKPV